MDALRDMAPDLFIVCDYGHILSSEALSIPRLGGINLHGSLLPRHRGAAPVQWSILSGDKTAGVTVIHMTPRLDGGPMIVQSSLDIGTHENAGELEGRLSQLGVPATLEALDRLRDFLNSQGEIRHVNAQGQSIEQLGILQDKERVTKAPRLAKSDGQLDFRYPATDIDRQLRGLQPWPGVYGELEIDQSKKLRVAILSAIPFAPSVETDEARTGELLWGESIKNIPELPTDCTLAVRCKSGYLGILELQPAGKRSMLSKEFLAGYGKSKSLRFLPPATHPHPLLSNPLFQEQ